MNDTLAQVQGGQRPHVQQFGGRGYGNGGFGAGRGNGGKGPSLHLNAPMDKEQIKEGLLQGYLQAPCNSGHRSKTCLAAGHQPVENWNVTVSEKTRYVDKVTVDHRMCTADAAPHNMATAYKPATAASVHATVAAFVEGINVDKISNRVCDLIVKKLGEDKSTHTGDKITSALESNRVLLESIKTQQVDMGLQIKALKMEAGKKQQGAAGEGTPEMETDKKMHELLGMIEKKLLDRVCDLEEARKGAMLTVHATSGIEQATQITTSQCESLVRELADNGLTARAKVVQTSLARYTENLANMSKVLGDGQMQSVVVHGISSAICHNLLKLNIELDSKSVELLANQAMMTQMSARHESEKNAMAEAQTKMADMLAAGETQKNEIRRKFEGDLVTLRAEHLAAITEGEWDKERVERTTWATERKNLTDIINQVNHDFTKAKEHNQELIAMNLRLVEKGKALEARELNTGAQQAKEALEASESEKRAMVYNFNKLINYTKLIHGELKIKEPKYIEQFPWPADIDMPK